MYLYINALQAKLQSDVRQWITSGVQGTDATFTSDRIGWLFMECPSGLSPTSAIISGWIYGSDEDPADKYIRNMQKMADKHATIEVGSQKVQAYVQCHNSYVLSACHAYCHMLQAALNDAFTCIVNSL